MASVQAGHPREATFLDQRNQLVNKSFNKASPAPLCTDWAPRLKPLDFGPFSGTILPGFPDNGILEVWHA